MISANTLTPLHLELLALKLSDRPPLIKLDIPLI